jgi:hypothetical protein
MTIVYRNINATVKIALAIGCVALVVLWPRWRAELQAQGYGPPPPQIGIWYLEINQAVQRIDPVDLTNQVPLVGNRYFV